jgi:murein DD-endopeptidase MepM/ murein hydrolase activator NlpD
VRSLAPLLLLTLAPPAANTAIRVTTAARSMRPGEIVLFTITVPERADAVRLRAFAREIEAYESGEHAWNAIVGIDLDVKPGAYAVTVDADIVAHGAHGVAHTATLTHELRVGGRVFPTRQLRVDEAFVNPPAGELERIDREAAALAAVWRTPAAERLWNGPFVRPVPGPASSRFGTRSVFNGQTRNAHSGGDFLSPAGTPVHAPNSGRVVVAQNLYFSGNTVVIDHGLGLFSLLAHLSAVDVGPGDRVDSGQVVGTVGATGRVTGPHLHWAVRASGARVDPRSLLALMGPTAYRAPLGRRR